MKRSISSLSLGLTLVALFCATHSSYCIESEPVAKEGVKALQLGAGHDSIQPGQPIEIGLLIEHLPEYHTYWKAPGIVGLPTSIKWTLPEGFSASDLEWPVPEVTKMAQYTCYGYERDVCLITKIQTPKQITSDSITIKARVAYMCCAKSCHPGYQDFELTIPVSNKAPTPVTKWQNLFAENRKELPQTAPENWSVTARTTKQEITMTLQTPDDKFSETNGIHFFCGSNTVHSDRPQKISFSKDKKEVTFSLVHSEFAPKDIAQFTGLIFSPKGWPGSDSKWIQINTPLTIDKDQTN